VPLIFKVRISVYFQIVIAIFLVAFLMRTEDDDAKTVLLSTYVNIAVTLGAIAIAILAAGDQGGGYSGQQGSVIGVFSFALANSLVCISSISLLANRRFLYILVSFVFLSLSVAATLWRLNEGYRCMPYDHATSSLGSTLSYVCYGLAPATVIVGVAASLRREEKWNVFVVGAFVIWTSDLVITIVAAETIMRAWFFDDGMGYIVPLTASGWQLGQIMAVCVLAAQIWGVLYYYWGRLQTTSGSGTV